MPPAGHVVSLHTYPIKSCRGIELDAATVERRGFARDRRFMVVDADGVFRTQRKDPELARVQVTIAGNAMRVEADGVGSCEVALDEADAGPTLTTTVWRHVGSSIDQGDAAASFFGDLLGAPSRLVYMADDEVRPVSAEHAAGSEDIVGFADGYPFLVCATASLADLQSHMDEHVPMDRFRPNIVVETAEPWVEESWRRIRIGKTELAFTRTCTRCAITTTDQHSGERFREPLRTLGRLRRTDAGVVFGSYFAPVSAGGRVQRGAEFSVVDVTDVERWMRLGSTGHRNLRKTPF